jgi:asparagine synthase (glutamine-hydrolysing)
MCGIVGIVGEQPTDWIDAMNLRQRHRGPDDGGVFVAKQYRLAMAMRRLAIIDLSGGQQPMVSLDGRYALVYNGEIFNSPQLRTELELAGEHFATDHSDTEVLFRLLQREGRGALPRLNGMFAFAFADLTAGKLLCARDRFGIKPFYYTQQSGRFAFASELKSLLSLPFVDRAVDRQSLFHYLSLLYVPGARSIISGVSRLPPAHSLSLDLASGSCEVSRWWHLAFEPDDNISAGEWPERIRSTLDGAVRRWSMSDVPIGASLSGGLDSSAVVALARNAGVEVRTFSLGFTAAAEAAWNELPLARKVAQCWGTQHEEVVLNPEALLDDLDAMVAALDEPYAGGLPSWHVFKLMGQSVKAGLTGTGGDEMFGNYGKWMPLERRWSRLYLSRNVDQVDAEMFSERLFNRFYYFSDEAKRAILADAGSGCEDTTSVLFSRFKSGGKDVRDAVGVMDLGTQLPDEFLHMTDRFSMAHSLEARTPFLDNDLVDLVRQIPARFRTSRSDYKWLLRKAVAPLLPPELMRAPKKGFVIPLGLWLRGRLADLARRLLDPERLAADGIFRPEFYHRYVAPHLAGSADHTHRIWAVLMFQLWHEQLRDITLGRNS